jgi:MFS family permease
VLAATFGLSLISDMYRPAGQAYIADVVAGPARMHAFALNYVAINLGFAVAPFVGGMLAERSFALLFYVDAVTSAFFGVLIALTIPESLAPATESQRAQPREGFFTASARILKNRVFVVFCVALFLVTVCFAQAFATLPISMNQIGITEKTYGRIIAVNGVLIVLLQLPMTAVVARMDRARALCASALLVGTGFGLTAIAGTWVGLVGAVAVWTCGEMMQSPLLGPVVADLAPAPMRARYMAFSGVAISTAAAIGSAVGGHFFASYGPALFWPGVALLAYFGAVLFLALGKRLTPVPAD